MTDRKPTLREKLDRAIEEFNEGVTRVLRDLPAKPPPARPAYEPTRPQA